jgi:hypothetical protein
MADIPGGAGGMLVRDCRRKKADWRVLRIDPGVVALVVELRGHERQAAEELEKGKTHHEERRVIDASPAAITLALALSPVELDELERGQRIKGTPARVGMEQMKIADENSR